MLIPPRFQSLNPSWGVSTSVRKISIDLPQATWPRWLWPPVYHSVAYNPLGNVQPLCSDFSVDGFSKTGMLPHRGDHICSLNLTILCLLFRNVFYNMWRNIDIYIKWFWSNQIQPLGNHAAAGWMSTAPFFGKENDLLTGQRRGGVCGHCGAPKFVVFCLGNICLTTKRGVSLKAHMLPYQTDKKQPSKEIKIAKLTCLCPVHMFYSTKLSKQIGSTGWRNMLILEIRPHCSQKRMAGYYTKTFTRVTKCHLICAICY